MTNTGEERITRYWNGSSHRLVLNNTRPSKAGVKGESRPTAPDTAEGMKKLISLREGRIESKTDVLDYSDQERDDENDIGPRAHTRGPADTTGRHRTEASTIDREPGDEIVTSTDKVSKLVYDCWKVRRRGYGRVIVVGRRLSARLAKDIAETFPTVILKEDA